MGNGGKCRMLLTATAAALAIGASPVLASAQPAESVVAGNVTLEGAGKPAYAKTDAAGAVALGGNEGDYNLKFQDGTLYLNHATVSCIAGEGILGDGDLRIMLNGDSSVKSQGANGIEVDGSLWIGGEGSLDVESGVDRTARDGNDECDGIYAAGDIVIDNVSVKASGLDQGESEAKYGVGIYSEDGDVVIKGANANVEARGGRAAEVSAGISANAGSVKIGGGTVVASAGDTNAGKGSVSGGIHAARDISVDAATLTASAGEATSSAGIGSAFGSLSLTGDSVVSASSSAKEGVGISAVSASLDGGKLLASGNFEAARCPKGFTVAPDSGEVVNVSTADDVKSLPSDVDNLKGMDLEAVDGAPFTKEGELPVDALRANVLYATEKKPAAVPGPVQGAEDARGEDPVAKDDAAKDDAAKAVDGDVEKVLGDVQADVDQKPHAVKTADTAGVSESEGVHRKGAAMSKLPQTGDANLMLPLVFAGVIGVALLIAGIALLFDRRK